MIALIYICSVLFAVTQTVTTKIYAKESDNSIVFNTIKTVFALLFFGLISIGGVRMHIPSIIYGCLYGIALSLAMYTAYTAISLGIASLTSVLVSFSVIIPIVYGIAFCGENMTAPKAAGMFFLVLALVFANIDKMRTKSEKETNYVKWLLFVFATFVLNGTCSVLQKMHQNYYPGEYLNEFMLSAMILSTLAFVIVFIFKVSFKELKATKGKVHAAVSGAANAIANYSTLALAGLEHASVLYPLISAGTILAVLLCGRFILKESLKKNHFIGLACGLAAVVFLKL